MKPLRFYYKTVKDSVSDTIASHILRCQALCQKPRACPILYNVRAYSALRAPSKSKEACKHSSELTIRKDTLCIEIYVRVKIYLRPCGSLFSHGRK